MRDRQSLIYAILVLSYVPLQALLVVVWSNRWVKKITLRFIDLYWCFAVSLQDNIPHPTSSIPEKNSYKYIGTYTDIIYVYRWPTLISVQLFKLFCCFRRVSYFPDSCLPPQQWRENLPFSFVFFSSRWGYMNHNESWWRLRNVGLIINTHTPG